MSFRAPSRGLLLPGSTHRAPIERDAPLPEPTFICVYSPSETAPPPGSLMGPVWREVPISRAFFYTSFVAPPQRSPDKTESHLSFKVHSEEDPPPLVSSMGPLWRELLHFQSQWFIYSFIHSYLSESLVKEPCLWNRENIWSLCTEPHVDGMPTCNGVRPDSPVGSLMTLLLLPQCHAACIICSSLAWVDQSPASQFLL
jgi:hypothetical protein